MLLPIRRDFTAVGCVVSFLKRRGPSAPRKSAWRWANLKGILMRSSSARRIIRLATAGSVAAAASAVLLLAPVSAGAATSVSGHTLSGHTLAGHTLSGHTLG